MDFTVLLEPFLGVDLEHDTGVGLPRVLKRKQPTELGCVLGTKDPSFTFVRWPTAETVCCLVTTVILRLFIVFFFLKKHHIM